MDLALISSISDFHDYITSSDPSQIESPDLMDREHRLSKIKQRYTFQI